jgi:hypothetical protein
LVCRLYEKFTRIMSFLNVYAIFFGAKIGEFVAPASRRRFFVVSPKSKVECEACRKNPPQDAGATDANSSALRKKTFAA